MVKVAPWMAKARAGESLGKRQAISKRLGAWGCWDADAAVTLIECKGIGALQREIREKRKSSRNEFEM